ncbi:MAG: amidohydrolase [Caldilineaceae bacterium]|nr:amidohydrolase [Caldilineaceae bacterium]
MPALPNHADLILRNATIYTLDDDRPWASAVAVRKHRIIAVGKDDEIMAFAGPQTDILNLDGQLVLPGLCDAHIHFFDWSLSLREVQLADCTSKTEMLARIADRAATTPRGEWITGRGWNESRWGATDFPTAADLDGATGPDQPALFWRSDMHGAVANHAALALAGITATTMDPPGGVIDHDATGEPTGFLREMAIALVANQIPPISDQELEEAMQAGMATLHRHGITAIHDQRMKDHGDGPRALAAYQRLYEKKQLQLRVNCNIAAHDLPHLAALALRYGFGNDYLRVGHVKVFTDGSLGTRTAWMLAPFAKLQPDEADNFGVSVTPPEQMAAEFRAATALGFPISVHAIGDRANRVVLDIFEEMASAGLTPPVPHRIEHVQIIDRDDLPRLARLNVTASVQPVHAIDDRDTADLLMGPRGAQMYNFRTLLEHGTLCAYGSDAPVADANPFVGIHAALTRQRVEEMAQPAWYPEECITLKQALYGYTMGAARAAGWEARIGSIEVGKRADLIVLDRDIFELAAGGIQGNELSSTQIELTIFDGNIVYQRAAAAQSADQSR